MLLVDDPLVGLTIKTVSERTGVPLHTLRAWERRYGVPRPKRQPENRYRLYDEEDIADVLWLKREVDAGMSPAQASLLLRQQSRHIRSTQSGGAPGLPAAALQARLMTLLLEADEKQASALLNQAFDLFPLDQVALQIIQPTMRDIGERWHRNEISAWQEHLASNLIRQKLLAILQSQPAVSIPGLDLVAACAPEEQHELGLLLLSLLARQEGWHVVYLGQRTPLVDLAQQGPRKRIVISVATVTGLASLIPLWVEENRPASPVAFGGELFNEFPRLQAHVPGSFLGGDATQAVKNLDTIAHPSDYWTPSRAALQAAQALQQERLDVAAKTIHRFAELPEQPRWGRQMHVLSIPTLFLVDALSSALAFDLPELMDRQGAWLRGLLVARGIELETLDRYLGVFEKISARTLSRTVSASVKELMHRFESSSLRGELRNL